VRARRIVERGSSDRGHAVLRIGQVAVSWRFRRRSTTRNRATRGRSRNSFDTGAGVDAGVDAEANRFETAPHRLDGRYPGGGEILLLEGSLSRS
jgi:hypothetical protein